MNSSGFRILPPYASSLGKAIAAFQTADRLEVLLRVYGIYPFTRNTITEPVRIRDEFARVRERGYACEREETVEGGCCFAAPVRLPDEPVRAAISVSLPVSRVTSHLEATLPKRLLASAARISTELRSLLRNRPAK